MRQTAQARTGSSETDLLVVRHLSKAYEMKRDRSEARVLAVRDVSFEVRRGELFTLLGPSGCGKTTTLRCIAGLERPDAGEIRVGDRILFSSSDARFVPASRRRLGMVFQSYAIWPHMSVFDNVAYPLTVGPRRSRARKDDLRQRVERLLDEVQLSGLANRRATKLSGGQQQRLALARALIMEPPLLLLDEPLSNLDAKLRELMRFQLKQLQTELGITAVYVTHDQTEALSISNVIAVVNDGKIQQIGTPFEIYNRPANRFVADFIGTTNFLEGNVARKDVGDTYVIELEQPAGRLRTISRREFNVGDPVTVSVRPEHVRMTETTGNDARSNAWRGRVMARAFLGESVDHIVAIDGVEVRVRSNPLTSIGEQTEAVVSFDEDVCVLLPR